MPLSPQPLPGALTRAVGRVLRDQMAERRITLADVSHAVDISQGQLSRMLHGTRRIDLEQFDALCAVFAVDPVDVLRKARGGGSLPEPPVVAEFNGDVAELGRRVRVLVAYFPEDAYTAASRAAKRLGVELTEPQWLDLIDGALRVVPDVELLQALSTSLGAASGYLVSADAEEVARVEAELELADTMRKTGTSRLAARALSNLGVAELRAITELLKGR